MGPAASCWPFFFWSSLWWQRGSWSVLMEAPLLQCPGPRFAQSVNEFLQLELHVYKELLPFSQFAMVGILVD